MLKKGPIGVFDSGYGGLTVLKEFISLLPEYDFLYLGDNARTPYGTRSFETVYEYTLQCVKWLLKNNCPLIILACNTASAKALRSIQQNDLYKLNPEARVLGVIRPTAEVINNHTTTKSIGILGTTGTIQSGSYQIEIGKIHPEIKVHQHACPLWVPLIENNQHESESAEILIKNDVEKLLTTDKNIDAVLLACTHYPLIIETIKRYVPENIEVISQGEIVAKALQDYLRRHPDMDEKCSKSGKLVFYTTDSSADFDSHSGAFFGRKISSQHLPVHDLQ
ncbi:glutamate racemase [soil metagenome]